MVVDGVAAQHQLDRDLGVGKALGQEGVDLQLAAGEPVEVVAVGRPGGAGAASLAQCS